MDTCHLIDSYLSTAFGCLTTECNLSGDGTKALCRNVPCSTPKRQTYLCVSSDGTEYLWPEGEQKGQNK